MEADDERPPVEPDADDPQSAGPQEPPTATDDAATTTAATDDAPTTPAATDDAATTPPATDDAATTTAALSSDPSTPPRRAAADPLPDGSDLLPGLVAPHDDPVPRWLRSGAAIAWRVLAIVAAVAVTVYALAYLRVVVLPVIVAILLSTVLRPPTRWLVRRRFPDGLAAATVMVVAIALLASAFALAGAAVARQFSDLADSVQDGVREAGDALAQPPFNLSKADIREKIDQGVDKLSESSSELTGGALHGAVLVGEAFTGFVITVLLLFFFLKDGPGIWRWVVETCGGRQRRRLDELARRCYAALSGYVRGLVLVGVVDASLIGVGLLILGVPLVAPLMLLTFLGAFVPLIGAFFAGLAAVLIALVSGGLGTALIVLGLVIAVQQIEGHLLYPIIMGRTVNIHPIAIILALAIGGILAGIVGVFISVPIVTVAATALHYLRETREQPRLEPGSA